MVELAPRERNPVTAASILRTVIFRVPRVCACVCARHLSARVCSVKGRRERAQRFERELSSFPARQMNRVSIHRRMRSLVDALAPSISRMRGDSSTPVSRPRSLCPRAGSPIRTNQRNRTHTRDESRTQRFVSASQRDSRDSRSIVLRSRWKENGAGYGMDGTRRKDFREKEEETVEAETVEGRRRRVPI